MQGSRKFVSLMYHNVHPETASFESLSPSVTSYFTNALTFQEHLAEIAAVGGRWLNVEDLPDFYANNTNWSSGYPVLLTFDDGWRGTLESAAPILESYNASAILFVTSDFIGRPSFVTRQDIQHLSAKTIQLGSHARSHRMLDQLSNAEITMELRDSKSMLEDLSGHAITCLSIPGGAVDQRVRKIAADVGYRFVFTSEVRVNTPQRGPLSIGRVPIRAGTTTAAVSRYVTQRFEMEQLRQSALQISKRLLGRPRYERLRRCLLREAPGQQDMREIYATPISGTEK